MSFGIGIGDFIKVVEVADKIISKCKAATLEFRDLSRDVVSMQIVLDAVQKYWERQKLHGRDLSESQRDDLKELTLNCREVLDEIEALLHKHGGLEAGTGLLSRIKWLRAGDLGPLRMRLLARTMYLSQFNSAMVANDVGDPTLGAQARVLNTLNVINYRYHTGKRSAPAFTQATAAELDRDSPWKEINEDLEKEGLDPQSIATEKPFIKKWIDDVILAEDNFQTGETSPDDESIYSTRIPPTSEGGQDQRSLNTESTPPSQWSPAAPSRMQTDRTLVERSPQMRNADLSLTYTRDSRTSISSRGEQRRVSEQQPRSKQIQASLVSLFRLEHGVSRDLAHLRTWIEHIFLQLDTRQRGIFRGKVEEAFIPAIEIAKPSAKQTVLDIILSDTSRPGSRLDQAAFVNMMFKILESLDSTKRSLEGTKTLDATDSNQEIDLATSIAYSWLLSYVKTNYTDALLPYGWRTEIKGVSTRFYSYVPQNITCHRISLPNLPPSTMSTFTCMSLMVSRSITELYRVQGLWEAHAELDEQYLQNYLNLIDDVLEAAHKFDVFDERQASGSTTSLDQMLGQAEVVDLTDAASLGQVKGFPIQELRDLQRHAYRSFQSILAFLIELTTEEFQANAKASGYFKSSGLDNTRFNFPYPPEPPAPGHFRIKMESQATRILADASEWWETSSEIIAACRKYAISHKIIARQAEEALDGSRRLGVQAIHAKRCKHLVNLRSPDLVSDKFIILMLERLENLPKGNKIFRAGPPDIEAKIVVDNIELGHKAAVRTQVGGKDVHRWNEGEPFHISISSSSTLFIRIHNTKRRVDRIDEGFMGLICIDLDKLPTALDADPITLPLKNSYKPGLEAGNITLRIHWCPLAQYVRLNQSSLTSTWARKETADDRFYFEDLRSDEKAAGSRTAIFETRNEKLVGDVKPLLM